MVGKLLARQQQYLQQLVEKRRLDKEREDAESAAAKQLMLKVNSMFPVCARGLSFPTYDDLCCHSHGSCSRTHFLPPLG